MPAREAARESVGNRLSQLPDKQGTFADEMIDAARRRRGLGASHQALHHIVNVDGMEQVVPRPDHAVASRLDGAEPTQQVKVMGRRDASLTSDMFGFFIDPYYDRRSGFYFLLNAAGTMYDGVLFNDEWDDNSWDGVWEGKVKIDEQGWMAEMRIPYSQLRFKKQEQLIWGVNLRRDIARNNERDYLVFTPKNGSGFVSRFADLVGITNVD